jgi:hypothetical protein
MWTITTSLAVWWPFMLESSASERRSQVNLIYVRWLTKEARQ